MSGADLGVAVIGAGFGARVVAPAFAATAGLDVVAVVSARDEAAVVAAIADPRVALVSIHSPPFLHERHVAFALDAGRSVLCDKPFSVAAESAGRLVADAADAPGVHLVNFEFRFDPVRRRMRSLVGAGSLGPIEHISWTHISAGSREPLRPYGWLFDRARGGGWIGAWGSHAVDTLRFCFGEVESVVWSAPRLALRARPDPADPSRVVECTAEDGLSALLTLRGGASVSIDSTFAASATVAPRLVVVGRDATLENVADRRLMVRDASGSRPDLALTVDSSSPDHHAGPMLAFAAALRDAVRTGEGPPTLATFADGLACAEILDLLRAPPLTLAP